MLDIPRNIDTISLADQVERVMLFSLLIDRVKQCCDTSRFAFRCIGFRQITLAFQIRKSFRYVEGWPATRDTSHARNFFGCLLNALLHFFGHIKIMPQSIELIIETE